MSAAMKKYRIKQHHLNQINDKIILRMFYADEVYAIPKHIAVKYKVKTEKNTDDAILADDLFAELDKRHTKAGALLKGLRYREGLNQTQFAKKIHVSQADLSKMENGKRPIGKIIAKRIQKTFGVNYRYFLA